MTALCHACGVPMDDPRAEVRFSGFRGASSLNGITFTVHARCLRLAPTDRAIALPETEADLVTVSGDPGEWTADCRDHGFVAIKEERDDAHLAAAFHIARKHQEDAA